MRPGKLPMMCDRQETCQTQVLDAAFLFYVTFVGVFASYMIFKVAPKYGTKNPMVYLSICSLVGSVSVMAIKVSVPFDPEIGSCLTHVSSSGLRYRAQADICRQ